MNHMLVLIRREIWEHRSLWIAPLVVAGVILFITALGGIHVSGDDTLPWVKHMQEGRGHIGGPDGPPLNQQNIYATTMATFTGLQLFTLGIVVFFYLIDTLLTERKDRSILFWKSLPISDAQVVLSKVLTALVIAPAIVLVVSAVMQLLFGLVWWARFNGTPLTEVLVPFHGTAWMEVQVAFLVIVPAVILWYLPIAAYLLLVSVWARRNAFLWAVMPPIALLVIEAVLTPWDYVRDFIGDRFGGAFEIMGRNAPDAITGELGAVLRSFAQVFLEPEAWVGAVAAAAIVYASIRIRRYRDDS
jgi:ABC-2 type transport system permease protein